MAASSRTTSGPEIHESSLTDSRHGNGQQTNQRHGHVQVEDTGFDSRDRTQPREVERDSVLAEIRQPHASELEVGQLAPVPLESESLIGPERARDDGHASTTSDARGPRDRIAPPQQTSQVQEMMELEDCEVYVPGPESIESRSKSVTLAMERRLDDLERQNVALTRELGGVRQELHESKVRIHRTEQRLGSTTELLRVRTKEWEIAQQFLTTADSLTESDVLRMVTRLNSEIFQLAGQIANSLPSHLRRKLGNLNTSSEIPRVLGNALFKLLKDSCEAADPSAAIQVAIQAVLINYCTHLISSWHNDNVFNDHFKSLYRVLQNAVEPSIAGKWRALTRSSLDKLHDKDLDSRFVNSIMSTLSSVLTAADFDFPAHPLTLKRDLTLIADLTLDLRRAIAAIESYDLEVFLYPTDTTFDPKVMGRHFQEKRTRTLSDMIWVPNLKVFRTTEMGLKRMKRADDKTRGIQRQDILLQAKVVLGPDLQHIL